MSRHAANATPRTAMLHARPDLAVRPLAIALIGAALLAGCSGSSGGAAVAPGIGLSTTSLATTEGGPNVSFTVVLTTPPTTEVDVELTSNDSTEGTLLEPGSTYSSGWAVLTFTPQNWNVPQTVQLVPEHDTTPPEGATTVYTITATAWSWGDTTYAKVPSRDITVTNSNIDIPGITVSKTTGSTSEAMTSDTFTVVLNTAPGGTVTIPVTSTDTTEGLLNLTGGGLPGPSKSLTFTTYNWNTPQTVTVYGQNDLVDDGNQTYAVTVGPATGDAGYAALLQQTVTVTNIDDDTAGITITKSAPTLTTSENGTVVTFTVRLNTEPVADVTVPVMSGNVAEGLVSAGVENLVNVAHLTFTGGLSGNWAAPQTVTVTGQDEATTQVAGDNVQYDVSVGPATGDASYAALAAQAVQVLNTDNDTPTVIVSESVLQTSETGSSKTATFTVAINKQPTTDVVIPVTVSDVTEGLVMGGSSPSVPVQTLNLTFTNGNFQTPQPVTVSGQIDNKVDGSQTYTIAIGPPSGDVYGSVSAKTLTVHNADTDIAGFTIAQSSGSTSVVEGGAVDTFTVKLNTAPEADVIIPVTSGSPAEGTLSKDGAIFGTAVSLTFTPGDWSTPQTVSVRGEIDNLDDGDKTYGITVGPTTSTSTPYNNVPAQTFTATTVDADTAGLTVSPSSGLTTTEAGGTATFTVKLNSKPLGTVTIPISVDDTTEAFVDVGGAPAAYTDVTFTATDWNTPKTVTVTGLNDPLLDGARPFTVSVGPTVSSDPKYNLAAKTVTGSNTDNEIGVSEGTSTTPAVVAAGSAFNGQVGPSSSSYYQVNLAAGATFSVSLADATAAVTLTVDDNGTYASGNFCTNVAVAVGGRGACTGTVPSGGAVYVRVSTSSTTGAGFTLTANTMQTFTSLDVPKSVPTNYSWATSTVSVSNAATSISKVRVKLSATHAYDVYYLYVTLKSPSGTAVTLMYYDGWNSTAVTNTIFDDAAANDLFYGTPPYTGTFKPYSPLAAFNGQNANGTWTLSVSTNLSGYSGSLTGWSIELL
jgi:subtilisin-like proprotein convertase family protein